MGKFITLVFLILVLISSNFEYSQSQTDLWNPSPYPTATYYFTSTPYPIQPTYTFQSPYPTQEPYQTELPKTGTATIVPLENTSTATFTSMPELTYTATISNSTVPQITATAIATVIDTATPFNTETSTPVPSSTETLVPSSTPTFENTATATESATATETELPTEVETPTDEPTWTDTPEPATDTPTPLPTDTETMTPIPTSTPILCPVGSAINIGNPSTWNCLDQNMKFSFRRVHGCYGGAAQGIITWNKDTGITALQNTSTAIKGIYGWNATTVVFLRACDKTSSMVFDIANNTITISPYVTSMQLIVTEVLPD